MTYSWLFVGETNVAEHVCRATDYFPELSATALPSGAPRDWFLQGPVVIGASGMIYPDFIKFFEWLAENAKHPVIAWGIGHNFHGETKREYPTWLNKFALVGLRDWGTSYQYVPCPTCMHPCLTEAANINPSHEVVIYEHTSSPVRLGGVPAPRMDNCHAGGMADVVRFLASGEIIITSTYHGAYWGMLLNRKVLVWEPWSTKFYTFKNPPRFVTNKTWRQAAMVPQDRSGYLEECRECNKQFAKKVYEITKG